MLRALNLKRRMQLVATKPPWSAPKTPYISENGIFLKVIIRINYPHIGNVNDYFPTWKYFDLMKWNINSLTVTFTTAFSLTISTIAARWCKMHSGILGYPRIWWPLADQWCNFITRSRTDTFIGLALLLWSSQKVWCFYKNRQLIKLEWIQKKKCGLQYCWHISTWNNFTLMTHNHPSKSNASIHRVAPGPRASEPAGLAGFLPDLSLRARPRPHLLVHRCWAVRPAWKTHCHGLHQHAQLGREVCSGAPLSSITGGFMPLACMLYDQDKLQGKL